MDAERLAKFGSSLYRRSVSHSKPRAVKALLLGLDTEYNEEGLLCWQLSIGEQTELFTEPLTWDTLLENSLAMLEGEKVEDYSCLVYCSFFSISEARWLDYSKDKIISMGSNSLYIEHVLSSRLKMIIFDIASFFPKRSLRTVAKMFGLKKEKYNVKALTAADLSNPAFITYAKTDAWLAREITSRLRAYEFASSSVDILLTKSLSSTAAAEFRCKYVPEGEVLSYKTTDLRRKVLLSSWGGRSEVFFIGKKRATVELDGSKAYQSAAIALKVLPRSSDWIVTARLSEVLSGLGGICHVKFEYPADTMYPELPVFVDERLIFPLKGDSWCTSFEVKEALCQGAKIVLKWGAYYKDGVSWLVDYENYLLSKQEQLEWQDYICKEKARHIIGKLTQKRINYNYDDVRHYSEITGIPIEVVLRIKGLHLAKVVSTGSLFYPEWHCLILGYARAIQSRVIKLHKALVSATDAIVTQDDIKELTEGGIYYRTKEGSKGTSVVYRSGLYRVGKKLAHRGIYDSRVAERILRDYDPDLEIRYEGEHVVKFKESLREGLALGSTIATDNRVSLVEYKRRHTKDGWTKPFKDIMEYASYTGSDTTRR